MTLDLRLEMTGRRRCSDASDMELLLRQQVLLKPAGLAVLRAFALDASPCNTGSDAASQPYCMLLVRCDGCWRKLQCFGNCLCFFSLGCSLPLRFQGWRRMRFNSMRSFGLAFASVANFASRKLGVLSCLDGCDLE